MLIRRFGMSLLLALPFRGHATESWPPALHSIVPIFRSLCETSPEIAAAKSSLRLAADRAALKSKYFLPRIDVSATGGLRDPAPANDRGPFGSGTVGSVGLSGDLALNPLLSASIESERSRLELERAKAQYVVSTQEQAVRLFDLVLAAGSLAARDQDIAETKLRLEKQYKTLVNSVRQGLTKRRDLQQFEAELIRLEQQRLQLKRDILENRESLNVLVRGGPAADAAAVDDAGDVAVDVAKAPQRSAVTAAIDTAATQLNWRLLLGLKAIDVERVEESPDLVAARLKREIAAIDLRLAEKRTGLVTSFSATYSMRNSTLAPDWSSDSLNRGWGASWFAGISLKYPLWDSGADALVRRESALAQSDAEIDLRRTERDFRAKRSLLADEGQRISERRGFAERLLQIERGSFEQIAIDYREGRAGYLEWINSNQSLQNAVRGQIDVASDWARFWMKSRQFRGELVDDVCP